MGTMNYKGYFARFEYDGRDNLIVGRVVGIRDLISFHGTTVGELRRDFRNAINHHKAVLRRHRISA